MTLRVLSKLVSIIEYPVLLYTGLATHDLIGLEIVDVRQYLPPKQWIMTPKKMADGSGRFVSVLWIVIFI